MTRMFYFGCVGDVGHYLWDENLRQLRWSDSLPWRIQEVDGVMPPQETYQQGLARMLYKGCWTAMAFWDRTVDTRPGGNSVFLADGTFTFDEMVQLAIRTFPSIMRRYDFLLEEFQPQIRE